MAAGLAFTAAALTASAAALAYAGLSDESQWFGPTLVAPPQPNQLALTFDDGPNPSATPRLLEILAAHNVRATFFLIGDYVRREPALTREIAAAGHILGNHTMHHPWLPRHSLRFIRNEILACNHALEDTVGSAVKLFRAPHGARRPAVLRIAAEAGLQTVQWNLIVGDWKSRPANDLLERLERGILRHQRQGRGTCVVLHDGSQNSPNADRRATLDAVASLLERIPKNITTVTPPLGSESPQPALP